MFQMLASSQISKYFAHSSRCFSFPFNLLCSEDAFKFEVDPLVDFCFVARGFAVLI